MFIDWNEAQAIGTVALVVTSAAAIGYAGLQLRHERGYRAVSNLEKQLAFFHSDKFVSARRTLAQARIDPQGELLALDIEDPPVSAFEVLDFYEHLGLLIKKGHLETYDVWHTFYEWVQPVYADLRPITESKDSPWSDHYTDLRSLVREMDVIQKDRMRKQKSSQYKLWSRDRIAEHYRYEIEASGSSSSMRRLRRRNALVAASSNS
ncbi:hypothetical protein [Terriglobus saanensis]|uniref:DUF4760 domain-containing protein n=1 Tax=Terriglobus saanensis (strain ATCC BAA-1853 / DSM 23119 / SP1PR4) TaxID=401053 RepID=E8V5W8_TERSS|nr:hypothetical protein [Terriglobus saanensis]ADV83786.1 hypothetical protein AciPR4_3027 [Terriglobus saanensis SP1PR4]